MSQPIDYPSLVQDALRQVVRRVLTIAADSAPGSCHLYVGFNTRAPGVELPAYLRDLFPEEMRIVLQHQFWDLEVDDDGFSVMLSFNAARNRLRVPFAAITAFYDADQDFALRFALPEESAPHGAEPGAQDLGQDAGGAASSEASVPGEGARVTQMPRPKRAATPKPAPAAAPAAQSEPGAETPAPRLGAKVVSLDAFRKK